MRAYRINTHFDLSFPGSRRSYRNGFTMSLTYTKPVTPPAINNPLSSRKRSKPNRLSCRGNNLRKSLPRIRCRQRSAYVHVDVIGRTNHRIGERVRFDASGLSAGKYVVRVTASDGRNASQLPRSKLRCAERAATPLKRGEYVTVITVPEFTCRQVIFYRLSVAILCHLPVPRLRAAWFFRKLAWQALRHLTCTARKDDDTKESLHN